MTEQPTIAGYAPSGMPHIPQQQGSGYQPPLPPAPPPGSTGKIVAIAIAVIVSVLVLVGLGVGALVLFGTRTIDPAKVQQEIVRITEDAAHVAPTGIQCPDDVAIKAGTTFTCSATVDGQPIRYTVRQTDDSGTVQITSGRMLPLHDVETTTADLVGRRAGVPVTTTCGPAGRTVLVNEPGTPIHCVATNVSDSTDTAAITVQVDATDTVTYTFD